MSLAFSRLRSAQDLAPLRAELGWLEFTSIFYVPRVAACEQQTCAGSSCPHKRGPCWSPAVYAPGGARGSSEIEGLSMLVLDVERVTDDALDALRGRLGHLRYLVHSTHSDRPAERSVRVIVPLATAVAPGEWRAIWLSLVRDLDLPVDASNSSPGRIYFLPSRPADAGYFVQVNDGEFLDAAHATASRRAIVIGVLEGSGARG